MPKFQVMTIKVVNISSLYLMRMKQYVYVSFVKTYGVNRKFFSPSFASNGILVCVPRTVLSFLWLGFRNGRSVHCFIICQNYMMSRWYCNPPPPSPLSFDAVFCFVCSHRRVAVIGIRLFVLFIWNSGTIVACLT